MENSVWRSRTKVVVNVNTVLSTLCSLAIFSLAIGSTVFSEAKQYLELRTTRASDSVLENTLLQIGKSAWMLTILWTFVVITAIMTVSELWAAQNLWCATEVEKDAAEVLEMARIWRDVEITFLIVRILPVAVLCFTSGGWFFIPVFFYLAWYGSLLFVICNFIMELRFIVTGLFNMNEFNL